MAAPLSTASSPSSRSAVTTGSNSNASPGGSSTMRSRRHGPAARQFPSDSSPEAPVRRSSNFSEYSLNEARDIINPRPSGHGEELSTHETSPLAVLSLAFALLPAVAGALFTNGSSIATDVMLLGLAAIFLHWSVTQPWLWYHDAQQMRIREEADLEDVVEDDSDVDSPDQNGPLSPLEDVPEEEAAEVTTTKESHKSVGRDRLSDQQRAAVKELYRHEVIALVSCFVSPLLSAYLLHAIRSQLSRPSEGLISNYNLTIFLMISELRVCSHLIKLVQSRTLRLQRIVHRSPHGVPDREQLEGLVERLERLEAMTLKEQVLAEQGAAFDSTKTSMTRDVRNAIQPDLDALNRAVRRYEKKAALLQVQTEARFSDMDERVDQVMSLATTTAKKTQDQEGWPTRMVKFLGGLMASCANLVVDILTLPLRPILALVGHGRQPSASPPRTPRGNRHGKAPLPVRYIGERVPTRLTRK